MSRRSIKASVADDRAFAVRVRIAIPGSGLPCLNELYEWLRQRAGPQGFAVHSNSRTGTGRDGAYLYADDLALLAECIRVFALEVLPAHEPGLSGNR